METAYRVHVKPRWGSVAVANINVLGVEAWITSMTRNGSGATVVLRAYGVLSGILADAVKGKRLPANPAKGVENLPRKSGKRRVYLSADDVAVLADESGHHHVLVLVLAYCGLRWGEAIGLRVRDVEFLRRRISVHENAVHIGVAHEVGPTKGREARSVPVPEFVLNELSVQCAGKASGELVFATPDGRYLPRPKSSNGWFTRAVRAAGVQTVTPHDLRHTCASLAVSAGVNVLALARMLGHKDPSVTLRVYADLFDTDLDALLRACTRSFPGKPCPYGVHSVPKPVKKEPLSCENISAGGGTRTLKLFRAMAPKTIASANFATPARPAIVSPAICPTRPRRGRIDARYGQGVSTTHRRRPALIALVIIAACGCLALGWWQWNRFQSVSGSFQNLGYALQWPLFAWFCVYAYRKFVRYEEEPPPPRSTGAVTEIPAGLLPDRPAPPPQAPDDPALREYNKYLAELAAQDAEKQKRTTA